MQNETVTQSHILPAESEVSFGVLTAPHAKTQIVVNANGSTLAEGTLWRLYSWTGAGAALIHECELTRALSLSKRLAYDIEDGARVELRGFNPHNYTTLLISASLVGYDPASCGPDGTLPSLEADYVIVGTGTAGAALARYLSENLTTSVIALEAGKNQALSALVLDQTAGGGQATAFLEDPQYHSNQLVNQSPAGSGGVPFFGVYGYVMGRMIGGSSGHNFSLVDRGAPREYDLWGAFDPQWSYANILPVMKFMENFVPDGFAANLAQRGNAGPLWASQGVANPPLAIGNGFVAAWNGVANTPPVDDFNDPATPGPFAPQTVTAMGAFQTYTDPTTVPPTRSWSQSAFLPLSVVDAAGRGVGGRQLEILTEAFAERILFDTSGATPRAIGVQVRIESSNPTQIVNVFARTKVILCTGGLSDPALLQRSGIGDSGLLGPLGIPTVVDNPNVGLNLQCHYGPAPVLMPAGNPNFPPFQGMVAHTDLTGDGTAAGGVDLGVATGQRLFQWIMFPVFSGENVSGVAGYGFLMRPQKTGAVQISTNDPSYDPVVRFNPYNAVITENRDEVLKALKQWANVSLAFSGAMPIAPPSYVYPAPFPGGIGTDATLLAWALANNIVTNHPSGTCAMGTAIGDGVVDGDLDVFGCDGLAVASNAVQPTITSGNTAYPAYLIGLLKAKIEGATVPY